MSSPECPTDPASDVVNVFIDALQGVFNPDGPCPPDGGGSTLVRFFAAPNEVLPAFGKGCKGPFLWVRVANRYRSRQGSFPTAYVGDLPCGSAETMRVLAVEVGVARCTNIAGSPKWEVLAREAEVALDDSWRIEQALCRVAKHFRGLKRAVATDTIAPVGVEDTYMAWTGMAYVAF